MTCIEGDMILQEFARAIGNGAAWVASLAALVAQAIASHLQHPAMLSLSLLHTYLQAHRILHTVLWLLVNNCYEIVLSSARFPHRLCYVTDSDWCMPLQEELGSASGVHVSQPPSSQLQALLLSRRVSPSGLEAESEVGITLLWSRFQVQAGRVSAAWTATASAQVWTTPFSV